MTDVTINQDGEDIEIDLAEIADIDMNDIDAFEGGFEPTPKGIYVFECKDAGLKEINGKAVIYFDCVVEQVLSLLDEDQDPEKLVGWKHEEAIFIYEPEKSVGQAKAIMQNAGFEGQGKLTEMLDAFCGHRFISPIKHRKNKNDADVTYSNFWVKKITPVEDSVANEAA